MVVETYTTTSSNEVEVRVDGVTIVIKPEKNVILISAGLGRDAAATHKDKFSGILTIEISPRMENS